VRLNRTKGKVLWMRAHFAGRLRAEIRATGTGSCVILVRRGDEPIRESPVECDPEAARQAADEAVREVYPHACTEADCGAWVAMDGAKT
jgi:hypothetical protein